MGNRSWTLLVIVILGVSSMALVLESGRPGTTVQDNVAEKTFEDLPSNMDPNLLVPRIEGTFLENKGQVDDGSILYYSTGDPLSIGFGTSMVQYLQRGSDPAEGNVITITFPGANAVEPVGVERLSHPTSFFLGNDPNNWVTDARSYGRVVYYDVWDGIDIIYRIVDGRLKYDMMVAPYADATDIALAYQGVEALEVDPATGDLLVRTPVGTFIDTAPWSYQTTANGRVTVDSFYHVFGDSTVGFELGDHDARLPLVIDPGLAFSTYVGSDDRDEFRDMAVDSSGNVYITGWTQDTSYPITGGAYCSTLVGGKCIFITKLNPTGTGLVFSTFLGGSGVDEPRGIDLGPNGHVFIVGSTLSTNYPTTVGANQTSSGGSVDFVVTKLNATGASLEYSTYIGGSTGDYGWDIKVDTKGAAYVGGYSGGSFPTTTGAFDTSFDTNTDGVILKLSADGSTLVYSTYIGGNWDDVLYGIDIDSSGNVYATGYSGSSNTTFPITAGCFCDTVADGNDGYALKLNATGTGLYWCGFIAGATSWTGGWCIAVDGEGSAYVGGETMSASLPVTNQSYDEIRNGTKDAFVAKIEPNGTYYNYITYLGGRLTEIVYDIWVDSKGQAHCTGYTASNDFPTTSGAYDTSFNAVDDAFYTILDRWGSGLEYSTLIGGGDEDEAYGLHVTSDGTPTIAGMTESNDFPTTSGAYCTTWNAGFDVFVVRFAADNDGPVIGPDNTPTSVNISSQLLFNVTISDDSGVQNASVEYWQGTGLHTSLALSRATGDAKNGTYTTSFYPYGSLTPLQYVFYATDTSGNANQTTAKSITLVDTSPPSIDDLTQWFGVATTGDPFQFVANVSDDVFVVEVRINYTIGDPPFIEVNTTMDPLATNSRGNGMYILNLTIPGNFTGAIPYAMIAMDSSSNSRVVQASTTVTDNDPPHLGPDESDTGATTGDPILLQINVTDNIWVSEVNVIYWYGTSAVINTTMNPGTVDAKGNGIYSKMVTLPAHFVGTFNYMFKAMDTYEIWNGTPTVQIEAMDDDPPTVGPDLSHALGDDKFIIEANASDNVGVVNVWVVYKIDDGTPLNVSMDALNVDGRGNGTYGNVEVTVPTDQQVRIDYTLYAIDAAGNIRSIVGTYVNFDYEFPEFGDDGASGEPVKGWDIELWVEVTDNLGVEDVRLEYWFGDGSHENVSMVDLVSTWNLTIDLPRHPDGDLNYMFRAVDIKGNWNNTEMRTIALINKVPGISESPLWEVTEEEVDVLDLEPYIVDPNDLRIDLSLSTDAPGVTVDRLRLTVEYDDWRPDHSIEVSVTDGEDTTTFTVEITVINVNDDPVITSEPGTTAEVGSGYEYIVTYTDVDPADVHTFSLDAAPEGMEISESGRITWTPTEAQMGDHTVDLALSDGWTYVHQIWTITVTGPVNGPPAFTNDPPDGHVAGTTYSWDAEAADPDGDVLTFDLTTAPEETTLDAATGILIWEPAADKRDTSEIVDFVMTVTDGELTDEISWSVVLFYPLNEPPVITAGLEKVKVKEENTFDLSQYMSDPDDPTEDLYWDHDEDSPIFGARIDGNLLIITPRPESKGSGQITLELYDPWGMVDTFNLTVEIDTKEGTTESESCWSFWWILLIVLAAVIVLLYMSQDKWRPKKEPKAMEKPKLEPAMED